jgi:hypothetical protein
MKLAEKTWRALVLLTILRRFENAWRNYDASGYKRPAITPSMAGAARRICAALRRRFAAN